MAGDEDDRKVNLSFNQLLLQFESAQSRQANIEDQAANLLRTTACEKFLCRGEGFDTQADRTDEASECFTNSHIVIDHIDNTLFLNHGERNYSSIFSFVYSFSSFS